MTLPPSLSELDSEADAAPELSRLTLVVGTLSIDVGLPSNVSIAAFIDDVIDIANEQAAARRAAVDVEFDAAAGPWTLARVGGEPIDPRRSLSEAGIYDGELLVIREARRPVSPLLFDDVEDTGAGNQRAVRGWLARHAAPLSCFAVAAVAAGTLAALLPQWRAQPLVGAAALALGAVGVLISCVVAYRSPRKERCTWVAVVALPLLFTGSLYVVPDGFGLTSLPMAFGLSALGALLVLAVSGVGRAFHSAVIGAAVLGGAASTATLLWDPPARTVGALLATASVLAVYLSPRVTIMLSKLPLPRVPTAGEPLDDIETQGGPTVEGVNAVGKQIIPTEEGVIRRVRRANEYLTGILIAAAGSAAVGCYLAVDVSDGFYWQGSAFAVVVATVLCLRGRSHHDLLQSATLIGSGLVIALAMIAKTAIFVPGWQVNAAVALTVLMGLVVACGLVAPRLEFSPVMRRQVEILEYVAIGLLFPLCFWIVRLYAFFREMRL